MKTAITAAGWILAVVLVAKLHLAEIRTERLIQDASLSDQRANILLDENSELKFHMQQAKTYEDGYIAAMTRSQITDYVDGYHTAIAQLTEADEKKLESIKISAKE